MKCDELTPVTREYADEYWEDRFAMVYNADEVDAAIAELMAKLEEKDEVINQLKWRGDEWAKACNQKDKDIESLKASHYAESVDAGMRERRLRRALWLDRAEKAYFMAIIIDHYPYTKVLHFTSRKRDESGKLLGVARTAMVWWEMFKEVERKCRAKAEEYK